MFLIGVSSKQKAERWQWVKPLGSLSSTFFVFFQGVFDVHVGGFDAHPDENYDGDGDDRDSIKRFHLNIVRILFSLPYLLSFFGNIMNH